VKKLVSCYSLAVVLFFWCKVSATHSQQGPFKTTPCTTDNHASTRGNMKGGPRRLIKIAHKAKSLSDVEASGVVFWPNNIRAFLWNVGLHF